MTTPVIEVLETRIAPAAVYPFTDVDGDSVVIKTSTGTSLALGAQVFLTDGQLTRLNLSGFAPGTIVSIVATKAGGGDGFVNVGEILAEGVNLGTVTVDGDLGRIVAGANSEGAVGVVSLAVHSLGALGTATGADGVNSDIDGNLGALTVKTDVRGANLSAHDIGKIVIGGSLLGGSQGTGRIFGYNIGDVSIGGDFGGLSAESGAITAEGTLGKLVIGGSVTGGGDYSAQVRADRSIASITIGGDVLGGTGEEAGYFRAGEKIGPITIAGDLRGGVGTSAGYFEVSEGEIGNITVGGSVLGGGLGGVSGSRAGSFRADVAGNVLIKGHLTGGQVPQTGFLDFNRAGNITVNGIISNPFAQDSAGQFLAENAVGKIYLGGSAGVGEAFSVGTAGSLTVKGSFAQDGTITGSIGAISIGGNLDGALRITGAATSLKVGKDFTNEFTATGHLPGSATIGGNLSGRFNVGDFTDSDGAAGVQPAVIANVSMVKVGGDVTGGVIKVSGSVKTVAIGGDLVGGSSGFSGTVEVLGDVTALTVGGSITGGTSAVTGIVGVTGKLTIAKIGGDVRGTVANSGGLAAGSMGAVTVGGSVVGTLNNSGLIATGAGAIGSIKIARDLVGGVESFSGVVGAGFNLIAGGLAGGFGEATPNVGSVTIGGSIIGSHITASPSNSFSDAIRFSGTVIGKHLGSVTVGRDIRAGQDLTNDADVLIGPGIIAESAGSIAVKGGVYGTTTASGEIQPAIILFGKTVEETATTNVVLKSLTVGRDVVHATITAGLTLSGLATGGQQIGTVSVGGNWVASQLLVSAAAGLDTVVGTLDDLAAEPPAGSLVSRIASITIGGRVAGTAGGADVFTFAAQQIGAMKIGGEKLTLNATGNTPLAAGTTGDVYAVLLPVPA